jgi:adenylate cyclase
MSQTRRLAAILAADVAGYSRLIEADEEGTLGRLKALRAEVIDPRIAGHNGRIVKTTGDGLLVEFPSVVDAVRCAAELQAAMADRNKPLPSDRRIDFRIGIHQGDIVVEDGDIFGDGVNIAARLEGLAEPGGICVSARVREDAAGRLDLAFEDIGEAEPEEHFASRARFPRCDGSKACRRTCARVTRQAVDRGAAVCQHVRRSGAGIFRRRHGRGDHHRAQPHPLALRDRP